jgi:type III restriction enzyme
MFPAYEYPELQDAKNESFHEIRRKKNPSSSFDFLYVVEHPRFIEFYNKLRELGYVIGVGDTSGEPTTGDIIPVDAVTERIPLFDITWPIQIFDEGKMPELSQIDIKNLQKYQGDYSQLKSYLSKLIIQETHVQTGAKTKTWKLDNDYFDYSHFLRQASKAVSTRGKTSILSAKQAEIAGIIDEYVSEYCFGESLDFTNQENYSVLNYSLVFDHVVETVSMAIIKLIEGYKFEVKKGVWGRLSEVPRIMVRESKSVITERSIYPRNGYQPKGGGFERDFMQEVLNNSADVLAFAKLDRKHKLKITYRDETGIPRNYEIDFIIKTPDKMYLVETKADKDIDSPNVAVKVQAANAWCEQATLVQPPEDMKQPQEWEYLIISESLYKSNKGLSFEAFFPLCKGLRDNIVAKAKSRLFL